MVKKMLFLTIFGLVFILTGCQDSVKELIPEKENQKGKTSITELADHVNKENAKEFTITAQEEEWHLDQNTTINAWTYNGTVPGEEIRVQQGDSVRVTLNNELDEPVTIHWHGVMLSNPMDGVPGVTQNAVQPGKSFTYEFVAQEAGTYWYHSHQQSSKQVDKGLYGPFIVEEKQKSYDADKVLIFDEWALNDSEGGGMMGGKMKGMMDGGMGGRGNGDMDTHMMYNTLSVNGKTGNSITPIQVKENETVRLRMINAGYAKRTLSFDGQEYRVVGNDGKAVNNGDKTSKLLEIAPGERIDVEFSATSSSWTIEEANDDGSDLSIPIQTKGSAGGENRSGSDSSVLEYTEYGSMTPLFDDNVSPDVEYNMNLGVSMGMMQGGMAFTINDETFPDTENINVEKGDIVRVNMTNDSMLDHPMHLHGHHFQIVSKNGKKLDKPLVKDLINVKPGESYEIIFKANNPGHWLFHCHDLVHANNGMVTIVKYNGVYSPFALEGRFNNQPE
ncbi:multicopper oxidase family protein [Pseudalkalibacillus caeni]|uniref:Copper-containing nitrite reductase n=1 Tax=Exobacillus caeni TaxID=2574798 RepID=A0A5R9EZ09_9BACL|nr:multicopper oxidase family protein [Pseudalkalibacillus caeni]TLS35436.1 multicopper oxidase family protein [Pseudalkalibacillus caeni]